MPSEGSRVWKALCAAATSSSLDINPSGAMDLCMLVLLGCFALSGCGGSSLDKFDRAMASGEYGVAEEHATRSIQQHPNKSKGYTARAFARVRLQKSDQALDDAKKAVELNPSSDRAIAILAIAFLAEKEHDEAKHAFNELLKRTTTMNLEAEWSAKPGKEKEAGSSFVGLGLTHLAMIDRNNPLSSDEQNFIEGTALIEEAFKVDEHVDLLSWKEIRPDLSEMIDSLNESLERFR